MLERLEIDEAGAVAAGSPTGGRGSPGQPLSPKDDPSAAASAAAAAAAAAKKPLRNRGRLSRTRILICMLSTSA